MTWRWIIEYYYNASGWTQGSQYFTTLEEAQRAREDQTKVRCTFYDDRGFEPPFVIPRYRFTRIQVQG